VYLLAAGPAKRVDLKFRRLVGGADPGVSPMGRPRPSRLGRMRPLFS
jgi:hypothetical protein